jgi:hypothetical protein
MAALWARQLPYRSTHVVVERLPRGWRLTLNSSAVEKLTLVEAFETLLGHNARNDELAVVLAALGSAHAEAPADAALTRELHSLDLEKPDVR